MKGDHDSTDWKFSDTNGFSADSAAPGHDNLYDDVNEEYAAEIAGGDITNVPRRVIHARPDLTFDDEKPQQQVRSHSPITMASQRSKTRSRAGLWAFAAIIAAIASWFVWPTVLASVAIIAGIVAYTKGRRAVGGWSVALGIISLAFFLIAQY